MRDPLTGYKRVPSPKPRHVKKRAKAAARRSLTHCQAGLDGECYHKLCPQIRDGEPEKSNRFCPLPSCGLVALRERGE